MIANDYRVQGLGIAAIASNDARKCPKDVPGRLTEFAFSNKIEFPLLVDETQEVARTFGEDCTPDFYLFDAHDKLVYHRQLDDSRPGNNIPLSGSDLRNAIDGILYNRAIATDRKRATGTEISWYDNPG